MKVRLVVIRFSRLGTNMLTDQIMKIINGEVNFNNNIELEPWLDKIQENFSTSMASTIVVHWSILKNKDHQRFWSVLKANPPKGTIHSCYQTACNTRGYRKITQINTISYYKKEYSQYYGQVQHHVYTRHRLVATCKTIPNSYLHSSN